MFFYIESVKVHLSTAGLTTINNDRGRGHNRRLRFFKKVWSFTPSDLRSRIQYRCWAFHRFASVDAHLCLPLTVIQRQMSSTLGEAAVPRRTERGLTTVGLARPNSKQILRANSKQILLWRGTQRQKQVATCAEIGGRWFQTQRSKCASTWAESALLLFCAHFYYCVHPLFCAHFSLQANPHNFAFYFWSCRHNENI